MLPAPSIPSMGQGQPSPQNTRSPTPPPGNSRHKGPRVAAPGDGVGARRPGSQAQGHPTGAAGRRERASGQLLSRIQELLCGPRRPSPVLPAARGRVGPAVTPSPGLREPGPGTGGSQDPGPTPPLRPFPLKNRNLLRKGLGTYIECETEHRVQSRFQEVGKQI